MILGYHQHRGVTYIATKTKLTVEEFCNKRAVSARNSFLARAKRLGIDPLLIPSRKDIQSWMESNRVGDTFLDYLSNTYIPYLTIELDHKIPVSRSGSFGLDNLGITSRFYNNSKGDMTTTEFLQLLGVVSSWEDSGKHLLLRLIRSNLMYSKRR
jgi:5-methylcytosine-specific restriction endonuclease McrA